MKRDRFRCTYCGVSGTDAELEVDHIIPKSKGGGNHMSNLTTACRKCNQSKSDRPAERIIPAAFPNANPSSIYEGMFLHTFNDGRIKWQGMVVKADESVAIVRLFSWADGAPTRLETMPISTLSDPQQVHLYATDEEMVRAHLEQDRSLGKIEVEENMECWEAMRNE